MESAGEGEGLLADGGRSPDTCEWLFAAALDAPARARRAVKDCLHAWDRAHLTEQATLGVTELVGNAVFHTASTTESTVRVVATREGMGVRIEVHDTSPLPVSLPSAPEDAEVAAVEEEATTGRGLLLVDAVADGWGVETHGHGKTVWFEVGTGRTPATRQHPETHHVETDQYGLVAVRLVGVPVRLAIQNDAHIDDLIREFQVIRLDTDPERDGQGGPLISAVVEMFDSYAVARFAGREAARDAAARGDRLFDATLGVPAEAVPDLWHLIGLLEEIDDYCRRGVLLTVPASGEVAAYRRWWVTEVERQVGGQPPSPCPFPVTDVEVDAPPQEIADSVLNSERTVRLAAERAAARLAALQRVTAALADVDDHKEVARVVLGLGLAITGARTGSFCLLADDGITVEITDSIGYPEDVTRHWQTFSLGDDVPVSEAIRTGTPVYLGTVAQRDERYPVFRKTPVVGDEAVAVIPLRLGNEGRAIGGLVVGFLDAKEFSAEERLYFATLADQTAQALERVRLREADRAAREKFEFLAEASALLNASLALEPTLAALCQLAVPRLGDWCSVHIAEADGTPRFVAAAHTDPAKQAMAEELNRRWPPARDRSGIARVITTGEEMVFQSLPEDLLRELIDDDDHLTALLELGFGSGMVVPLAAGGRVLGALAIANEKGRVVAPEEMAIARDLRARAGAAIANALLYEERLAQTRLLQETLLPRQVPRTAALDFAARYIPAGRGVDVGGDFYDFVQVGGHWLVVIGDVCGKGVEAAAVTGLARHTIRSAALAGLGPVDVLRHLNKALLWRAAESEPVDGTCTFLTAIVAEIHPDERGADVRIVCAGHPLPLHLTGGQAHPVGTAGDLLGAFHQVELTPHRVHLDPGDALVLVTDGATERRDGRRFLDSEGVEAALANADGDAEAIATRLERAVRDFAHTDLADDLALVVARVAP